MASMFDLIGRAQVHAEMMDMIDGAQWGQRGREMARAKFWQAELEDAAKGRQNVSASVPAVHPVLPGKGLADVIEMCKTTPLPPDTATDEDLTAQIARAEAKRADLFDLEIDAKAFVENELRRLRKQQTEMKARAKFDGKWRTIPLDVLRWRDDRGLPTLVPFSLSSPRFVIEAIRGLRFNVSRNGFTETGGSAGKIEVTPKLPAGLMPCYSDVIQMFAAKASMGSDCRASAVFGGVIPDDIRATIREVKDQFSQIFIITEVKMDFTEVKVPVGDPIVAGWDDHNLYYIADFDTTAVEEAALLEGPARIGE